MSQENEDYDLTNTPVFQSGEIPNMLDVKVGISLLLAVEKRVQQSDPTQDVVYCNMTPLVNLVMDARKINNEVTNHIIARAGISNDSDEEIMKLKIQNYLKATFHRGNNFGYIDIIPIRAKEIYYEVYGVPALTRGLITGTQRSN